MNRLLFPALIGLVLLLAAALAWQIGQDGSSAPSPPSAVGPVARPASPAEMASDSSAVQRSVAAILARPLFAPDRRPIATTAPAAATAVGLPRLAGVVVTSSGRQAIFAAGGDGRQIAVAEGGQIGAFTISRIDADAVIIAGPDGSRMLRPSFAKGSEAGDKARETPPPAARPQSSLPQGTAPSGIDLLQSSRKFPIPAASKQ